MILVVSDIHLAERANDPQVKADDDKFLEFLEHIASDQLKDGGDLVLLGDIFDLWRRDFVKALMESRDVISKLIELKLRDKVKIHYLAGNHDYHMLRMSELLFNDLDRSVKSDRPDESELMGKFPFKVTKSLRLEEGGNKFFFIHGYQLEVLANSYYKSMSAYETFSEGLCLAGDDTGNAADKLWETYETSKSVLEGLKHLPTDIRGALTSMMNPPDNRLSGSHQTHTIVEQVAISKARASDLGNHPQAFLGGFFTTGSNVIVMNKNPLQRIKETKPELYKPYAFHVLLHEYIHSLGYLDENKVKSFAYQMTRDALGEDHLATQIAANAEGFMKHLVYPDRAWKPDDEGIELVDNFDRSSVSYIA